MPLAHWSLLPPDPRSTPSWLLPAPIRRFREHLRGIRQLAGETRDAVYAGRQEIRSVTSELSGLAGTLSRVETQLNAQSETLANLNAQAQRREDREAAKHKELVEILRFVLSRGPDAQERLRRLREAPGYELAFSETEPLVSVVIPTYTNYELLSRRALPSVLAQSYQNFEVVVVGDAAPEDSRAVVEEFGDPRIRFSNLPYRGPYPDDPEARWRVAGVPPYNEAARLARGLWIAPLDDDDAFRPQHLERVLSFARAERLELAYGQFCIHLQDNTTWRGGLFPPQLGNFTLQSVVYHRGLAELFTLQLSDAWIGDPYDWGMCRRMMEAGVRMGMLDQETADYYPSKVVQSPADFWTPHSEKE